MRRRALQSLGFLAAAICVATPPAALAQSAPPALRGTQDGEPAVALQRPVLVPDGVKLRKPASVTRMGAARRPPLRAAIDPTAVGTLGTTVAAPDFGASPVSSPEPPAPRRSPSPDEQSPYDPLGVRAGAFLLHPTIDVDFGYSDNPGQQPGKVKGATFATVAPALAFESEWTRHELRGSIAGEYTRYFGAQDPNRPGLDALLAGRVDVSRDTALETELRLSLDTERIGDDGVPADATTRPLTVTYGSSAGIVQRFGRTAVALRGIFDANEYQEVEGTVSRDYQTYGAALRGSYELSPAVQPFVQVRGDWRQHDDPLAKDRDSSGGAVTAGAVLDLTGTIKGEASLGYGARNYEGAGLDSIAGILGSASLVWTPTALTTVTLTAGTSFDETSTEGASGYVTRTAAVEVAHALRRNVVAMASLAFERNDYDGIYRVEDTLDAGVGIEYRLSRTMAVRGKYAYERLASTVPGADYTANSVMVGLRLQR